MNIDWLNDWLINQAIHKDLYFLLVLCKTLKRKKSCEYVLNTELQMITKQVIITLLITTLTLCNISPHSDPDLIFSYYLQCIYINLLYAWIIIIPPSPQNEWYHRKNYFLIFRIIWDVTLKQNTTLMQSTSSFPV